MKQQTMKNKRAVMLLMESKNGYGDEIQSAHLNVNKGLSALAKQVNYRIRERVDGFGDNDDRIEYLNCFKDMQDDDYKSPMCWTMKPMSGEDYSYYGDSKPWTASVPQIKVKALKAAFDYHSAEYNYLDSWFSLHFWIMDADDIEDLTGVSLQWQVIE